MNELINVLTIIAAVIGFLILISGLTVFIILKATNKGGSIRIVPLIFIIIGFLLIIPGLASRSFIFINNQKEIRDNGPLKTAVINKDIKQVRSLLKSGADPNKGFEGTSPLIEACKIEDVEIAKLLIEHGADVNAVDNYKNNTLMALLSCYFDGNSKELVNLLLDKGVKVNEQNEFGETPLFLACKRDDTEVVQLLIDKGADIKVVNDNGDTCLISAACIGNYNVAKLLIKKGVGVDITNKFGQTALMQACQMEKNIKVIKLLVESGADINGKDDQNKSPLMYCCDTVLYMGANEVKFLLDNGADASMVDAEGLSALDYVNSRFNKEKANISADDQVKYISNYKQIVQLLRKSRSKLKDFEEKPGLVPSPM